VGDRNVSAPITQLCLVLSFGERMQRDTKASPDNPWAQMDLLYHFLLQRLPSRILSRVRKILFLHWYHCSHVERCRGVQLACILGLPQEDIKAACGFLQSVLYLEESDRSNGPPLTLIQFYHASFIEFMAAERRSKDFCIYGDCLVELQEEIIDRLNQVHDQVSSLGRLCW
jgi:hypothetical protein